MHLNPCKLQYSSAGIRALACMGVLMGHVIYFVAQGAQDKAWLYAGFEQKLWPNWALHAAEPSMDFFMVLTGRVTALMDSLHHPVTLLVADFCGNIIVFLHETVLIRAGEGGRQLPCIYKALVHVPCVPLVQSMLLYSHCYIGADFWPP